MRISDDEMREIFAIEGQESLEKLEEGLLALEKSPDNSALIESVFRVAHSLKGSAGMLGVGSIESLAHSFEDILDAARRGRAPLTSAIADQLYGALDAMRALLDEAITGTPARLNLRDLLESLKHPPVLGKTAPPTAESTPPAAAPSGNQPPTPSANPASPTKNAAPPAAQPSASAPHLDRTDTAPPPSASTPVASSAPAQADANPTAHPSPSAASPTSARGDAETAASSTFARSDAAATAPAIPSASSSSSARGAAAPAAPASPSATPVAGSDSERGTSAYPPAASSTSAQEDARQAPSAPPRISARADAERTVPAPPSAMSGAAALHAESPAPASTPAGLASTSSQTRPSDPFSAAASLSAPVRSDADPASPASSSPGFDSSDAEPPAPPGLASAADKGRAISSSFSPGFASPAAGSASAASFPSGIPAAQTSSVGPSSRSDAASPGSARSPSAAAPPIPSAAFLPSAAGPAASGSLSSPSSTGSFASPPPRAAAAPATDRVDHATAFIRVDIPRLDSMLERVGDLVVTTARAGLRKSEVEGLRERLEQWQREWRAGGPLGDASRLAGLGEELARLARQLEDDQSRLAHITEGLRDEIYEIRLLPLSTTFGLFPRLVRDLANKEGKQIALVQEGGDTTADRRLLESLKEPLMHLVRNAIDHGIERPAQRLAAGKPAQATLQLKAFRQAAMLCVELSDDGAGLDLEAISRRALEGGLRTAEQLARATVAELSSLIFVPGFSTRSEVSDLSGRGTGMDAVRTAVESLNGSVELESQPGGGTTFRLRLPLAVSTVSVMVCQEGGHLYALPLNTVDRATDVDTVDLLPVEGRANLDLDGAAVPLCSLALLLGRPHQPTSAACVVLREQNRRCGFVVGQLLGVMEVVVKPLTESPLVLGASILPEGSICLLLHAGELLRRSHDPAYALPWRQTLPAGAREQRVLLAEDSATMRNFERKLLEAAGYLVTSCRDGHEAWERAQSEPFHAVVSDVEMPHLSGLELTRRLRALAHYREVPVVLVTSLSSDADRRAGLEAGATAYLSKASVESGALLRCLERLL